MNSRQSSALLLTNDDGVHAPGIAALYAALQALNLHALVAAPLAQRSGAGQAITLDRPLRAMDIAGREHWWGIDGTPADCVYLGRTALAGEKKVGLVVSGINDGPNLAEDTLYSGTVAAAREAAVWNIPAIAFSSTSRACANLNAMAAVAARLTARCLDACTQWPEGMFLNVNLPDNPGVDQTPWVLTGLGRRSYGQDITRGLDPRGRPYWWIGGAVTGCQGAPGSDCHAVAHGRVSITPLHVLGGARPADPFFTTLLTR